MKKEKYSEILAEVRSVVEKINAVPEDDREEVVFGVEDELRQMKGRNGDTLEYMVFKTHDTAQFGDIDGNRIINEDSIAIEDLASSMAEFGNLVPLIKNREGKTVDGQRRIRAVRKFGLSIPLLYWVKREADIDTVGEVNRNMVKWNHQDWLHKYIAKKNPHYIQYREIAKKYEPYVKSRSLRSILMTNRYESFPARTWEKGQFTINKQRLPEMIKFLNMMEKVFVIGGKDNIFANDRNFQKALYDLFIHTDNLDVERLLYKIQYGFGQLNVRTDYKTYKKMVARLYNSRLKGDLQHVVAEVGEEVAEKIEKKVKKQKEKVTA